MLFIFISYLLVLAMLLVTMIKERRARTDERRFLNSPEFWEVYVICISLTALFYMVTTSEELQLTDSLTIIDIAGN